MGRRYVCDNCGESRGPWNHEAALDQECGLTPGMGRRIFCDGCVQGFNDDARSAMEQLGHVLAEHMQVLEDAEWLAKQAERN